MPKKSHKHQSHKKKSKEEPAKKLFFWESKIFSTSIFIVVLLGAFLGITQLTQSDANLTGEAQRMIAAGSSEPYFKLYDSYSKYYAERGERITLGNFNDALYRSNVFFLDSSKNYAKGRIALMNKAQDMRIFTNKVYAKVDSDILDKIAWWMVMEDRLKIKTLALDKANPNWQKPLSDSVWKRISGREPQFTTKSLSKSAFVDCIDRMSKDYVLPDKTVENMVELSELGACLQSGIENENLFWDPFAAVDPSNWKPQGTETAGAVDPSVWKPIESSGVIAPGGDPSGGRIMIITPGGDPPGPKDTIFIVTPGGDPPGLKLYIITPGGEPDGTKVNIVAPGRDPNGNNLNIVTPGGDPDGTTINIVSPGADPGVIVSIITPSGDPHILSIVAPGGDPMPSDKESIIAPGGDPMPSDKESIIAPGSDPVEP